MSDKEFSEPTADAANFRIPVPTVDNIGWLLVGGGVLGAMITLLRDRRNFSDIAAPLGLIAIGSGVLLKRRQTHMVAAEEKIRSELDALDPIARAQILKAIAGDELRKVPFLGSSE
ncbi:MAG: hypothetical protein IFK93_15755 [Acidobacteria bacterium]|nr:hypothetical protein [Candidatus Sulfomarinibacter kjeldsenii]MBD3854646.1 hypothetical protein [Candidatus Sulfomarinibacter sp. MAG AM2]